MQLLSVPMLRDHRFSLLQVLACFPLPDDEVIPWHKNYQYFCLTNMALAENFEEMIVQDQRAVFQMGNESVASWLVQERKTRHTFKRLLRTDQLSLGLETNG